MSAVGVANMANNVLKLVGWFIVLVGLVWAGVAIWAGFDAVEPWAWHGIVVDEEWKSISLGFLSAVWILVYTGFFWALCQVLRLAALYYAGHRRTAISDDI